MECSAKNAASIRRLSVSQAMALAPFSQNSALARSASGSGQAQLVQSMPPG